MRKSRAKVYLAAEVSNLVGIFLRFKLSQNNEGASQSLIHPSEEAPFHNLLPHHHHQSTSSFLDTNLPLQRKTINFKAQKHLHLAINKFEESYRDINLTVMPRE